MQYATVQDMINRFGEAEMIQLSDPDIAVVRADRVQRALDDAQAMMDGHIGAVYRLPLTGCVKPTPTAQDPRATTLVPPPDLTRMQCQLARYYLHDDHATERARVDYEDAVAQLKSIATGKATITCPWGGVPGTAAGEQASVNGEDLTHYDFAQRAVTEDVTNSYR